MASLHKLFSQSLQMIINKTNMTC